MEKKKILLYVCAVLVFGLFLFLLFYNNTIVSNRSLGASVETVKKDTDNEAVIAARKYVSDNIAIYDGFTDITVDELKRYGYMTGDEIYEKTGAPFGGDLIVQVYVRDRVVQDAFLKNVPFSVLYECTDVCYINQDNYIAINGKVYRILKLDYNNNIYITENKFIKASYNIDNALKNYYNDNYDTSFNNVISLTYTDITTSTFINKEENMVVNTGSGYKNYNVISDSLEEVGSDKNIMPVIMLNNDVKYENGTGTSMDPFIINK